MAEPPEVLRTTGLAAGYGGPPIIEDISLTVRAGQVTAIVGPNGAGKSTLLKALSGVLRVSRGDVYIQGQKTTNVTGGSQEQDHPESDHHAQHQSQNGADHGEESIDTQGP